MVKEILSKALEDAVSYYNGGMSANDAIVKSAMDHDLTVDQTDRVVESFNTAKTINYFDKNASDRTGSFDLASKKDVVLAMFGKGQEKSASAQTCRVAPGALSSSFYTSRPDRSGNRKNLFAEKRAALLDVLAKEAEEKWSHGYSDKTIQDMASDAYATIKAAEADIDGAIGTIDSYLWSATEKIAGALEHAPYGAQEDMADLFKVACPHKIVVDQVSKFSPLLKKATGGEYARTSVVDTTPVDDLLKEADDIVAAVAQRKEYRTKKAEFAAKAERLKEAMFRDPSLSSKVVRKSAGAESFIHAPVKKASSDFMTDFVEAVPNSESYKKINEQIRDDVRGSILADLLSSDPILQDADPRQVASIYKSLTSSAPRMSLNKEIVRSVLRGAVNSIAISPADSKVFTDVDKGIQVAYGGIGGQKSQSDE
jgi:hypothetical protein